MTIKGYALSLLQLNVDWCWSGILERQVSEYMRCKTSNVGRRLRELENEGLIERRLERIGQVNAVQYRYKIQPYENPETRDEEMLKLSLM